jgi:hypothetical protein
MTRKLLITLSCGATLCVGCKESAYFQSPFQSNANTYKAMPRPGHDGAKTATYASGTFSFGGANHRWRDGVLSLTGSLHRGHAFGNFRAFYGVDGALGGYKVRPLHPGSGHFDEAYPNDSLINVRSGRKFFGGVGASGGIYLTHPFNNGGEWRIIGTELSWMNEFGNYHSFRKNLPDTAANLISRHRNFVTVGFHTDIDLKTRDGSIGLKLGAVLSTRKQTVTHNYGSTSPINPGYFSMTWHYSYGRTTSYWQTNIGTWTFMSMFGLNYRL